MTSLDETDPQDPFNLARFVTAQEDAFEVALAELRRGRKQGHWMWYIFPQVAGLGTSPASVKFAIQSLDEARAYLRHPVLGPRLRQCCRALLAAPGRSASDIMGYPDDLKLRSSMTLFAQAAEAPGEFGEVLRKFFGGTLDPRTLQLLDLEA